jgi:hypothetical protein
MLLLYIIMLQAQIIDLLQENLDEADQIIDQLLK